MENSRSGIFYFVGACGAGILFRSFFNAGWMLALLLLLLAGAVLLFYACSKARVVLLMSLALFGAALGLARMEWDARPATDSVLLRHVGERVELLGIVNAEPDMRDRNQLVRIKVHALQDDVVTDNVLLSLDSHLPIAYGDRVHVAGELREPENFETDSGRIFNYVEYLAKEGVHFRMLYPEVEVLQTGQGNPLLHALFDFKNKSLEQLSEVLPEPEVSLLGGILIGAKQSLGEVLLDTFRATGLIHIVVLSGYNMSLIAEGLQRALVLLSPAWSTFLGGVGIVLFALMAGAGAATVRAAIMALFVLLARSTGRVYDVTRALMVAAFLMVMHNPRIVAFDPGFQLSFIATLGLIHVTPLTEHHISFLPERFSLRSLVAATIATQFSVLPLLLYQTGSISIVAVLANLFVLPIIPVTMLLGSLTGFVSFLHDMFAYPFALFTNVLLSYILHVAALFAIVPHGSISVQNVPFWGVALLYVLGIVTFLFLQNRARKKKHNIFTAKVPSP